MRVAVIIGVLLVAGSFVAFAYWWNENNQRNEQPIVQTEVVPLEHDDTTPPASPDRPADYPLGPGKPTTMARAIQPTCPERQAAQQAVEGQKFTEMLASDNDEKRREALLELGKLPDTDPNLLTDVLDTDPSPQIRAAAAQGLSRLKRHEALPELIRALDDEDLKVRTWAITAIHNTCHVRFVYRADAPRKERLWHIENIKKNLTTWGVLDPQTQ